MHDDWLFRLIEDRLNPEEVVDILGIGVGELCLYLRSQILDSREKFEDFMDIYDEEEA
jgi:hypothetical protein